MRRRSFPSRACRCATRPASRSARVVRFLHVLAGQGRRIGVVPGAGVLVAVDVETELVAQ